MYKSLSSPQKWILKGIPTLFFIGFLMHYIYDFSNNNIIVGLISPVNESIWEHLKLLVFPLVSWWVIYYIFNKQKYSIDKNKWFTGTLISLLTSLFTIPIIYYFYTGAFGIESLFIDILSLLIAIIVGQLLGYHFYKFSKGINSIISIIILIFILI
ncbi:MAG: DUF6512 family protein, partial [Clostridium sp.]